MFEQKVPDSREPGACTKLGNTWLYAVGNLCRCFLFDGATSLMRNIYKWALCSGVSNGVYQHTCRHTKWHTWPTMIASHSIWADNAGVTAAVCEFDRPAAAIVVFGLEFAEKGALPGITG